MIMDADGSYHAVLIDDDLGSIKRLKYYLGKYCSNIKVLGYTQDFYEGILLIEKMDPDIIFLDIQLKDATGFDLLDITDRQNAQVIFMSADEKYALKAFKYQPIDYLVKPFTVRAIKLAINNVVKKLDYLKEILKDIEMVEISRITVSTGKILRIIDIEKILFCESSGNYSIFHLVNSDKVMALKNLGYFEGILPEDTFFRIHKKYLVNVNYIRSIYKTDGAYCELPDNTTLTISRRKRDKLLNKVNYQDIMN